MDLMILKVNIQNLIFNIWEYHKKKELNSLHLATKEKNNIGQDYYLPY